MPIIGILADEPSSHWVSQLTDSFIEFSDPSFAAAIQPRPQDDIFWEIRFNQKVHQLKNTKDVRMIWMGDSIIHYFETTGKGVWDQNYAPWNAVNFGSSGDRTENLRWRIQNAGLSNLSPQVIIVMIGTNNYGQRRDSAEMVAAGVYSILHDLKTYCPSSKVLLLGQLPVSEKLDPTYIPAIQSINSALARLADGKNVVFADPSPLFMDETNRLKESLFIDGIHPNSLGFNRLARFIDPYLARLTAREEIKGSIHVDSHLIRVTYPATPGELYNLNISTDMKSWYPILQSRADKDTMEFTFPDYIYPNGVFFQLLPASTDVIK